MKRTKSILHTVVLLLNAGLVSIAAGSPLLDGNNAGVFVFDPESQQFRSYALGDWAESAVRNGDVVDVVTEQGQQIPIPLAPGAMPVLVNDTVNSAPMMGPDRVALSVTGLGSALSDLNNGDGTPQVYLHPGDGQYDQTVAVTLTAVPARDDETAIRMYWRVNGGAAQNQKVTPVDGQAVNTRFFLLENGDYTIEYWATQSGVETPHRSSRLKLQNDDPQGMRRDTDGDEIPDLVEVHLGLDPTNADAFRDTDGDGWPDFEEALRCEAPNPRDCIDDPDSLPKDSDFDGWSDFDEDLRSTNPLDPTRHDPEGNEVAALYPDRPQARRLYEVESWIEGTIYHDAEQLTKHAKGGFVSMASVGADAVYDLQALATEEELAELGLGFADIPRYLRRNEHESAVASGALPSARIPVGTPTVIRMETVAKTEATVIWTAKAWVARRTDPTPASVTAWLELQGQQWSTAEEWIDAYVDYLRERLVIDTTVDLSPQTGNGVVAMEYAIAALSDNTNGLTLLGVLSQEPDPEAVALLKRALLATERNFDVLHGFFAQESGPGGRLEELATLISDVYLAEQARPSFDRQIAALLQRSEQNDLLRYVIRLLSTIDPGRFSPAELDVLTDPEQDFDRDGVRNGEELAEHMQASRPDLQDTDGDGASDADDPCPGDLFNACVTPEPLNDPDADRDGDGVPDVLDNCPAFANPEQSFPVVDQESALYGVGAPCLEQLSALILTPFHDVSVPLGSRMELHGEFTPIAAANGASGVQWDFDGLAADSDLLHPGHLALNTVGSYQISLQALTADGDVLSTDTRQIRVVDTGVAMAELSVHDAHVQRPRAGSIIAAVPLSLNKANNQPVDVAYTLVPVSAQDGIDFIAQSGRVQLLPNEISTAIPVDVLGSTTETSDRLVRVELSSPTGAVIGVASSLLYIEPAEAEVVNNPPVAHDDAAISYGDAVIIDVLQNDTDADGDPLSVSISQAPATGVATVLADNRIQYVPAAEGIATFRYQLSDGQGGTDTGMVRVTVLPAGLGQYVVYEQYEPGLQGNALYRAPLAGPATSAERITPDTLALYGVSNYWISKDGLSVVYRAGEGGDAFEERLFLINLHGENAPSTVLLSPPDLDVGYTDVQFTPDGNSVVYMLGDVFTGAFDLVRTELDSPKVATTLMSSDMGAVQNFLVDRLEKWVFVDIETPAPNPMDPPRRITGRVPLGGGPLEVVAEEPGYFFREQFRQSEDGKYLFFLSTEGSQGGDPSSGLFFMDYAGASIVRLSPDYRLYTNFVGGVDFFSNYVIGDSGQVYFLAEGEDIPNSGGRRQLYSADISNPGVAVRLSTTNGLSEGVYGFAVDRDESQIAYFGSNCIADCQTRVFVAKPTNPNDTDILIDGLRNAEALQSVPQSQQFLILADRDGANRRALLLAAGEAPLEFASAGGNDASEALKVTPRADGKEFIYTSRTASMTSLYRVNPFVTDAEKKMATSQDGDEIADFTIYEYSEM